MVYPIFGRISRVLQLVAPPRPRMFLIFRFSDIALYALTLTKLFFTQCDWLDLHKLGYATLCIPQVQYAYTYANSDVFALSSRVFLFLLAAAMADRSPTS